VAVQPDRRCGTWLGEAKSVREWALRQGWAGKAISLHEAKGILIAGLGVLARYYGYDRSGSGRSRRPPASRSRSLTSKAGLCFNNCY
jgi:hypothetical protein